MTATAEPATGPNRAPSPVAGPGPVSPRAANRQGRRPSAPLAEALSGEAKFDAFTRALFQRRFDLQIMPAGWSCPAAPPTSPRP